MKPLIEKTLILAHRGASGYAPENTMEAFRLAVEMGADGIELDIHLTSDGQVVVCHDEKIDRTSNGQGEITSYTLEELRSMDFGYHFYNKERRGIKIPTLDEVFELVAPTNMIVNVEIKSSDPDIIPVCHVLVKRYGMQNRIIYSSFDHFQIERMKKYDPATFIAPLYSFNMLNPWNYCLDIGAGASHPKHTQIRKMENYVTECHQRGIRVHTWTANTEEDIQFLLDAGVDAIITNYPDVAKKLLNQLLC